MAWHPIVTRPQKLIYQNSHVACQFHKRQVYVINIIIRAFNEISIAARCEIHTTAVTTIKATWINTALCSILRFTLTIQIQ